MSQDLLEAGVPHTYVAATQLSWVARGLKQGEWYTETDAPCTSIAIVAVPCMSGVNFFTCGPLGLQPWDVQTWDTQYCNYSERSMRVQRNNALRRFGRRGMRAALPYAEVRDFRARCAIGHACLSVRCIPLLSLP